MNVLVVGSGGREHALAWAIARSERVERVFVAPGNAGTALDERLTNVPITDIGELIAFAENSDVAYTVVGPEAPLAAGIADRFMRAGLKIFGPTAQAAQLETSKDFAKRFMRRHGVPTADSETFTDAQAAHRYIDGRGAPIVVKADGLAAGKGVTVAMTLAEAHGAVDDAFSSQTFGDAGRRIVVEDYIEGEEVSFMIVVNGEQMVPMATSQDHKRLLDGDQGPNTGGMGAYSPAPLVSPTLHIRILDEVVTPTLAGLKADGIHYVGFLYAGLMITPDRQIKVLEFNCRMGDPETQVILPRLNTDAASLFEAAVDARLDNVVMTWDPQFTLGVVLAAERYPQQPRVGDVIEGLTSDFDLPNTLVFHAGSRLVDGRVVTGGGRVLCVVAFGETVQAAQTLAYQRAESIRFPGVQMRRDIGCRALPPTP